MPVEFNDWTFEQQRLFFRVYKHMRLNQALYLPEGCRQFRAQRGT